MARIRSIKPEFPQSESMGRVSRDARLCFIQMWTIADDEGRLRGNSRMLASLLFPYDDDAPALIDAWMGELAREGCIVRYEADGASYIQIAKWLSHQKIDKPSASKIPAFAEPSRIVAKPRESSPLDQGEDQGRDQGEEGIKERSRAVAFAPPVWVPPELWASYLKVRTKKRADNNAHALGLIVADLERFKASGMDAVSILETSVKSGWSGVFEPKGQSRAPPGRKTDALMAGNIAVAQRYLGGGTQ
jgi:hypothetical protein